MFPVDVEAPAWTFFDQHGQILLNATMDFNSARVTLALSEVFHDYVPGAFDPATTYMVEAAPAQWVARARPESSSQIVGDVLRGVPAGAEVSINTKSYIAKGSDISLAFRQPGVKEITVMAFPQRTWTGTYANN